MRACELCGTPLDKHARADARFRCGAHRAEAGGLVRLQAGRVVDSYRSLAEYLERPQRRTSDLRGPSRT
jgi:hypothetical protein